MDLENSACLPFDVQMTILKEHPKDQKSHEDWLAYLNKIEIKIRNLEDKRAANQVLYKLYNGACLFLSDNWTSEAFLVIYVRKAVLELQEDVESGINKLSFCTFNAKYNPRLMIAVAYYYATYGQSSRAQKLLKRSEMFVTCGGLDLLTEAKKLLENQEDLTHLMGPFAYTPPYTKAWNREASIDPSENPTDPFKRSFTEIVRKTVRFVSSASLPSGNIPREKSIDKLCGSRTDLLPTSSAINEHIQGRASAPPTSSFTHPVNTPSLSSVYSTESSLKNDSLIQSGTSDILDASSKSIRTCTSDSNMSIIRSENDILTPSVIMQQVHQQSNHQTTAPRFPLQTIVQNNSSQPSPHRSPLKSLHDHKQPATPVGLNNVVTKLDLHTPTPPVDRSQPHPTHPSLPQAHEGYIHVNRVPYWVMREIGRGGSSVVYSVLDPNCTTIWAIKKVTLSGATQDLVDSYTNEIVMLQCLRDTERVIRLHDFEKTPTALYLVLEYASIDLKDVLIRLSQNARPKGLADSSPSAGLIPSLAISFYWEQMLLCVKSLHDHRIVHLDLKPQNFVLVDGLLKLIDLGISKRLPDDATRVNPAIQLGTLSYMSPEQLEGGNSHHEGDYKSAEQLNERIFKVGRKSDIWSLGVLLYVLVHNRLPFDQSTAASRMLAIINPKCEIEFPAVANPGIDKALRRCLVRDFRNRASIEELLKIRYDY